MDFISTDILLYAALVGVILWPAYQNFPKQGLGLFGPIVCKLASAENLGWINK
ncbi:hypothetical protein JGUZn3_20010 [Entomobacter blattae]|uniref:Uncharacterized protein n=2 Tax=Entomobacter blattae TaxID=2762277 RepID=A0A7H1NTU6_9PROT|nr:hypothetical protein JGUZn3_20010 [Entomobacter blattae]